MKYSSSFINAASTLNLQGHRQLIFALVALSLTACANSSIDNTQATGQVNSGRTLLSRLRPKADPALVAHIAEEERLEAQRQAQAAIYAETAGAEQRQSGLGRTLPKVSTDPFSNSLIAPPAESVTAMGTVLASNNTDNTGKIAYRSPQLATYESAYSAVPPPPPGALGAGLVPPPPAVTLSTQAQAYAGAIADSAAAFYNNPYFNPFGVPAPPQAATLPTRRPAGLFGEGAGADTNSEYAARRHKAEFVPITPKGMESRSPYKQRDDLRALWKGALKGSVNLGDLSQNTHLIDQLAHQDVGLPAESTKGSFNVSGRQIETIFKSSTIDKRAFPQVRKVQSELVQAYYRYLSAYNKYALLEQTFAARKQEVELSDSDAEKQRAAADLAQSQNDLEGVKEDLRSAEIELAAASSAASARSVISRVAGTAPSVEVLAQGAAQSAAQSAAHADTNHGKNIVGFFDSMFKHPHASAAEISTAETTDLPESKSKPSNDGRSTKKKDKDKLALKENTKAGLFSKILPHREDEPDAVKATKKDKADLANNDDELPSSPTVKSVSKTSTNDSNSEKISTTAGTNANINFVLKNVSINPRKSVLTVLVKNSGKDSFEFNPDTIYIAEGNRKLSAAALRADFDNTSVEPNREVQGTITVLSRPWNDKLVIYLVDGSKTIQLKR